MKAGSNEQIIAGVILLALAGTGHVLTQETSTVDIPFLWIGILAALGAVVLGVAVVVRLTGTKPSSDGGSAPGQLTTRGATLLALGVILVLAGGFLGYRYWTYTQCLAQCDENCEGVGAGFAGSFRGTLCVQQEERCMRRCTFP